MIASLLITFALTMAICLLLGILHVE